MFLITIATFSASTSGNTCDGKFENQAVQFIVPNAVGGGYDSYGRLFAKHYSQITGAKVSVYNRKGNSGLLGANLIASSNPDGLTLGIINAAAISMAFLTDQAGAINPNTDITIMGRLARLNPVWVVGPDSAFRSVDDMVASEVNPVMGITDLVSANFYYTSIVSDLLGLEFDVVTGLKGTRYRALSATRGDVDFISGSFSSLQADIEAGDLTPILQITTQAFSDYPLLNDVPVLGGENGFAARQARQNGQDPKAAMQLVEAVETFTNAGRLIAMPAGLPEALRDCIGETVMAVLNSPELKAEAEIMKLPISVATADEVTQQQAIMFEQIGPLIPVVKARAETIYQ